MQFEENSQNIFSNKFDLFWTTSFSYLLYCEILLDVIKFHLILPNFVKNCKISSARLLPTPANSPSVVSARSTPPSTVTICVGRRNVRRASCIDKIRFRHNVVKRFLNVAAAKIESLSREH
jgi:hypothetical protein